MNKIIILMMVLVVSLFAEKSERQIVKAKVVLKNDVVNVKFQVRHAMYGKIEADKKKIKPFFITHIMAKTGGKTVYDIWTSPYFRNFPKFKFKYKDLKLSDKLDFYVTNNRGDLKHQSFKIKNSITNLKTEQILVKEPLSKNLRTSKQKAWKASSVVEAIEELYGSSDITKGKIQLTVIEPLPHNEIRINIKSKINFESIAVLKDTKPNTLVAVINTSVLSSIIDYDLIIKSIVVPNITITVIGKAKDGKLYKVEMKKPICKADCYGD